jgi:hypothetical protein
VALTARTVVLYPMLARAGVPPADRRLIALFGPRGLSTLLLALLAVFAGVPGSERLFSIACLVVLLSVVVHGGGIALFQRAHAAPRGSAAAAAAMADPRGAEPSAHAPGSSGQGPIRITIDELRALRESGEPVVIIDGRSERGYEQDTLAAAGAIRLSLEDPVADATARRLAHHATLVVYCA